MGGNYSQEASSCVRFASSILEREMQKIRKLEAQGLNPYELNETRERETYSKEERIDLTNKILDLIYEGRTQKDACIEYDIPLNTFRKWRQRYKL